MNLDSIRSEAMRLETTVNIYFKCNVNYDDTCKDNAFELLQQQQNFTPTIFFLQSEILDLADC